VAAALVMAGTRAVLRDRVETTGSLASMMARLNRLLAADLAGTRFMTMHLSVIDTRTGTFRWASAGHDPAIIYDPQADRFEEIDVAGLPLGVTDDGDYTEEIYQRLHPGMIITIGTDGIWEATSEAGEQFGKDRLRSAIRSAASEPAEAIVANVIARLREFCGRKKWTDDVTFIVVKITSIDRPLAFEHAAPQQQAHSVVQ
jgi:sigma-B regulation protein RsbU (phosphoserine phosphatase)